MTLIVCGSAASWSRRLARANATEVPVFDLTEEPHSIAAALRTQRIGLMGIGDGPATQGLAPAALTQTLAQTVTAVLHQANVTHLLLEGGATAVAVVHALGFTRLRADSCRAPGVGALRPVPAESPLLWIKSVTLEGSRLFVAARAPKYYKQYGALMNIGTLCPIRP